MNLTDEDVERINDKIESDGFYYWLTNYARNDLDGTEFEAAFNEFEEALAEFIAKLAERGVLDGY